ncbi:MAG: hypothetical protein LBI53_04425 [Candidatus Peribacteria bacterium]|jgi:glycerol-3-phosphate responsive antiterminator|nr:hypothetical protein [Candidatus Peribacteria bacterium]
MLSDNLVFETPNIEKKLVDLPIQYLAISRRNIASYQNLLKRIKNKGIKTYVFHVNFDEGKDEQWVWDQEMDSVYGMYADDLDLLSTCK